MAMGVGRSRTGAIADINVTPMADVMIVLLIIFMVATPFIVGSPVPLPDAFHAVDRPGDRLEVVVRSTGAVELGGVPFTTTEALSDYIAARSSASAAPIAVLIQADRDAVYGDVAGVLSACRRAGVAEVALAAERRAGS
jgi:biopolymer transport protein ExbD